MSMSDFTVTKSATVNNPKGLHLRPAGILSQLAGRFESHVEVSKDSLTVDARSVLDLLTLVAEQGSVLTIVARGSDAQEVVDMLVEFIETDTSQDVE